jgi:predicted phosphodiesterase
MKEKMLKLLLKKKLNLEQLSNHFKVSVKEIRETLDELKKEGKNLEVEDNLIQIVKSIPPSKPTCISMRRFVGKKWRFGYITDTHLGSKYERIDVLYSLYEIFQKAKIDTVFLTGNMIDGETHFNKYDIHKRGLEEQTDYFIEMFPRFEGITTQFITGDDHEGWFTQREGIDVGKFIERRAKEEGRNDLIYLGHMEHDIILKQSKGEAVLRLVHPGGGSAYAISYTTQKLIESYTPGEKPNILLVGHYHKAEYLYYRGVYAIQGGTVCDQTPFMRKKRLAAHVGGWIIEVQQLRDGTIPRLKAEWIPFFDRKSYEQWTYKWKKR